MTRIGLELRALGASRTASRRRSQVQATIGFPAVIRPSFTLGGTGGGIAYNREEFVDIGQARPRRCRPRTSC